MLENVQEEVFLLAVFWVQTVSGVVVLFSCVSMIVFLLTL